MSNLYKEREDGQAAQQVLSNPAWTNAWTAYKARILEEIEAAESSDTDKVMHMKRLLTASTAARGHLERIMKEGIVAAASIEFEENKKRGLRKILG